MGSFAVSVFFFNTIFYSCSVRENPCNPWLTFAILSKAKDGSHLHGILASFLKANT